tara:strand:- start:156 stop:713 length:558 start_codon:yes stop_codon:yes gene_type:complete
MLSFQSLAKADDIRDLQIEGISVDDNLLDHTAILNVTKNFIKNKKNLIYPKSNKFVGIGFKYKSEKYDGISFLIDPKTFRIVSVSGMVRVENKTNCEKKQKKIFKELSSIYTSAKIINEKFEPHAWDKTGESIASGIYLDLSSGDIGIECYIWSEKITAEKGWFSNLKVVIQNKEAIKFLTYEAY